MKSGSSTFRVAADPTHGEAGLARLSPKLQAKVLELCSQQAGRSQHAGLASGIAAEKSVLLDLVLHDFKLSHRSNPELTIEEFCSHFECLGTTLHASIVRAIDVQDFVDKHPELLGLNCEIEWPAIGDQIATFQVLEELGRGTWARVYLCHEVGIGNRQVVVKVARGGEYEADQLGKLDHRCIVPIYSIATDWDNGVTYICMPFRGRSTLQDVLDRLSHSHFPSTAGALLEISHCSSNKDRPRKSPSDKCFLRRGDSYEDGVLRIAVEIANGLSHSHSRGVIHGDLKPSNILLMPDGRPLLIDFNLSTTPTSIYGPRGGTLAYMAPELLSDVATGSNNRRADPQSEIYSFGVVLFQLLTGRLPFEPVLESSDVERQAVALLKQMGKSTPQASQFNATVNVSLEALLLQCLASDPLRRPRTFEQVARALSRQLRPAATTIRLARARPRTAYGIATALIIAIAFGASYLALRPPYAERQHLNAIASVDENDFQNALAYLNRALEADPANQVARFDRARVYLETKEIADAIKDFLILAKKGDGRSAAYLAYCFNLKNEPSASIHWYEKAIENGYSHWSVHNNLAMSYANGRSRFGHLERFSAAKHHLDWAKTLNADEAVVYNNAVELALLRRIDPFFDLRSALSDVCHLLSMKPEHPQVLNNCVQYFSHLSTIDSSHDDLLCELVERELRIGVGPSPETLRTAPNFAAVRTSSNFSEILNLAMKRSPISLTGTGIPTYVEPIESVTNKVSAISR